MKIEAGKFYKTRDGRKARIYATDGGHDYPIHGAIHTNEYGWIDKNWTARGDALIGCKNDVLDLIKEWKDLPLVVEFTHVVRPDGSLPVEITHRFKAFAGKIINVIIEEKND